MIQERVPREKRDKRRTPSNPRQTSQNFLIRAPSKKSTPKVKQPGSVSGSANTSKGAIQIDLSKLDFPHEGQILEMISCLEIKTQTTIVDCQVKSISVYDDQRQTQFSLTQDMRNPQIMRQTNYNAHYSKEYQARLNQDEVSYSNTKSHNIKDALRSKMIDWMLEVFGNYKTSTGSQTYFRAVNLMDQYLKRTNKNYNDQDLHLIGIGCMFLASKVEDIYQIPLRDFVARVAHGKYSELEIKIIESEILEAFQFNIYFPTHLNHLSLFFFKCFNLTDNPQLFNIFDTAIYILKMTVHETSMLQFQPTVLAAATLGYSLNEYLSAKKEQASAYIISMISHLQKQSIDQLKQTCNVNVIQFNECFSRISKLVNEFHTRFPELTNLERFG